MKKKTLSITLAAVLCTSLIQSPIFAQEGGKNITPNAAAKSSVERVHPFFTWNNPAPSLPVLLRGSAKSAGMLQGTLDEIDPLMEGLINDGVMPGAVAFVARSGQIVKHDAYGHAYRYKDNQFTETEEPIAMTEDTIFDLASISKIFTTTAAMVLYEQGLFQLDDPVAEHLPEFAANGKENVTIEQLMTHTSGFTAWIPLYAQGKTREDRIQRVLAHPLANQPGTTYTYSDLNMITLGTLVERLSGQRLDEFIREHLTEPLGMHDTMYNPPSSLKHRIAATEYQPAIGRGLVWGEVHDENAWSLEGVAGHAGVFSTAKDLAKLAHMFIKEGRYGKQRILQPETIKLLTENRIPEFPGDDHGLGWELNQGWFMDALSNEGSLGHTGYTGTSIVVNQENDTVAILLTNRVHPSRKTVSTNVARRPFARLVADAIPIKIDQRKKAWFAGYGDNLERALTTEIELEQAATLYFDTWHHIENESDYGFVQLSTDGQNWTTIHSFTGNDEQWSKQKLQVPENTRFIRFTYKTDATVNGRGWYVKNIRLVLGNGSKYEAEFTSEEWTKRNH